MSSNSPQAATIAAALDAMRSSQPGQRFNNTADILATPELSTASPWLDIKQPCLSQMGAPATRLTKRSRRSFSRCCAPTRLAPSAKAAEPCKSSSPAPTATPTQVQSSLNLLSWTPVSTNYPSQRLLQLYRHLAAWLPLGVSIAPCCCPETNAGRASVLASPDFRRVSAKFGLAGTLALPSKKA